MRHAILLLVFLITPFVLAEDPTKIDPPKSQQAVDAQSKHDGAVKKAKDAYEQAVIAADKKLIADLDDAMKLAMKNQNVDEVKRIDAAKSKAESQLAIDVPSNSDSRWIKLFASDDPTCWDKDRNSPDKFGVSFSSMSAVATYLKLTRLDSGDYVILKLPARTPLRKLHGELVCGDFKWNGTGRRQQLTHNGNQPIKDPLENFLLGIAQLSNVVRYHDTRVVVSESSDREGFAGWGFGKAALVFSGQQYGWNGDSIDKTIFEIDITDREITPEERDKLLNK